MTATTLYDTLIFNLSLLTKVKAEQYPEFIREYGIDKSKFVQIVTDIINLDALPLDERAEMEWISEGYRTVAYKDHSKKKVIKDYAKNLTNWYTYLYTYIRSEDFEICEQIKQTIQIEKKEALQAIKDLYKLEPSDEQHINEIDETMLQLVLNALKK